MTQMQANNSEYIENRTFDEIQIGDSATLVRTLRHEDIQMYAIMSATSIRHTSIPNTRIHLCCARSSPTACGAAR